MQEAMSVPTHLHILNDKWDLYYHLPQNNNWSLDSYVLIKEGIEDLETIIKINEEMNDNIIKNCMLFIMKTGITPMWEDPQNRNGGCFSYKVSNKFVVDVWKHLFCYIGSNSTYVAK